MEYSVIYTVIFIDRVRSSIPGVFTKTTLIMKKISTYEIDTI